MDEPDWKEEQRSVLTRLFDSAFKRREVSDNVETVNKHLDDGNLTRPPLPLELRTAAGEVRRAPGPSKSFSDLSKLA
jgi:hypothetical protein